MNIPPPFLSTFITRKLQPLNKNYFKDLLLILVTPETNCLNEKNLEYFNSLLLL